MKLSQCDFMKSVKPTGTQATEFANLSEKEVIDLWVLK